MNILKKIWQWLVYSSQNPEVLSLTLKTGVAYLALLGVDHTLGNMLVDNTVGFIVHGVQAIMFAGLLWGGARKVWALFVVALKLLVSKVL